MNGMLRSILLAALLAPSAWAQLQLFTTDGTTDTPVGSVFQIANAAPNDTLETRFRVRNSGTGPISFQTLSIAGQGFKISSAPSIPYVVASGQFVDFRVAFSPTAVGSYSANLQVNSLSIFVRGSAVASAILSEGTLALGAGATIDFGKIERGTSLAQTLTLSNPSSAAVSVSSMAVSGTTFKLSGITTPLSLAPSQSVTFQVTFAPQLGGAATGLLTLDQRSFALTGLGLDPPLPTATIQLASSNGLSAQQTTVSIQLGAASKVSGTGTLTMAFHPSVTGVTDDPAVQFLSGPQRAATVTVSVGDTAGKFGSSLQLAFQTGTTAGTIAFTLTFPNGTQQTTLAIAPAQVSFDLASGTRRVNDLDVSLTGFDNTRSAGQLAFTFYDKTGKVLAPGTLRSDQTNAFRSYFNAGQLGGAFALRATFPVTGDATQIVGVDVEMTNSTGVAKTQRITF